MIAHKVVAVGIALAAINGITHALEHGILGVGALLGASGAIYFYGVRPLFRFGRQTAKVHAVLLGDAHHRPLDERLTKIEKMTTDNGDRLGRVEKSIEVMAAQERKDVLDALTAAAAPGKGKAA